MHPVSARDPQLAESAVPRRINSWNTRVYAPLDTLTPSLLKIEVDHEFMLARWVIGVPGGTTMTFPCRAR